MCQCRKYHRKQQKKQLETLEPDCVNHHSCNPWSSTLRLWTFDAVFFCKFSVGIRRRNDCSKMCLRFARHPFRHTFTQRCGLFSCLTSCFLRIVYFSWCMSEHIESHFRIWIHVHVHISCVAVQMTLHKSSSAFQVCTLRRFRFQKSSHGSGAQGSRFESLWWGLRKVAGPLPPGGCWTCSLGL